MSINFTQVLTYLANIKIAYTNGYMESVKVVDIEDIDNLLNEIILPANQTLVKNEILKNYQKIMDYNGNMVNFLVSETQKINYTNLFLDWLIYSHLHFA